jgi:fibronectin type 3 domain-containing protein
MKRVFFVIALLAVSLPAFASHQVALSWTQTTDPVALNCVFRSATSGGENPANPLFCSTSPITGYTDSTVAAGATEYYTVDAVSSSGVASGMSNEVKTVIPLLPPTGLQAVAQ